MAGLSIVVPVGKTQYLRSPKADGGDATKWDLDNCTTANPVADDEHVKSGRKAWKVIGDGTGKIEVSSESQTEAELIAQGAELNDSGWWYCEADQVGETLTMIILEQGGATATEFSTVTVTLVLGWNYIEGEHTVIRSDRTSVKYRLELQEATSTATAWFDHVQRELDTHTTYIDGDQDGCYWVGNKTTNISKRRARSRAGGQLFDIEDDLNFTTEEMDGLGMPGIEYFTVQWSKFAGDLVQGFRALPRIISAVSTAVNGTSLTDLHSKRRTVLDYIKPDGAGELEPFILRYTGNGTEDKDIYGYYFGGLEGRVKESATEKMTLQIVAYDPRIRGGGGAKTLDTLIDNAAMGIGKWTKDDGWVDTLGAINGSLNGLSADPRTGIIYACGAFSSIGGEAVTALAQYDGDIWTGVGSAAETVINNIRVGPDGNLWAWGTFSNLGGVGAADKLAYWDGAAWNGVGVSGTEVSDIDFDSQGNLYAAGDFSGGSATYAGKYDGSSWSQVAATNPDAPCTAVSVANDDTTYWAGSFTEFDGTAAAGVAHHDGTTTTPLGSGITTYGVSFLRMLTAPNGLLYLCGQLSTAGGVSGAIAKWNGTSWTAPGGGVALSSGTELPTSLSWHPELGLMVGGKFDSCGGIACNGYAYWTGTKWLPADVAWGLGAGVVHVFDYEDSRNQPTIYAAPGYVGATTWDKGKAYTINNGGSTDAYPVIKMIGAGRLVNIRNETTGDQIWTNYDIGAGEEVTLDFRPGRRGYFSSSAGNLLHRLLDVSDMGTFRLAPGDNLISVFVNPDTSMTFDLSWDEFNWSAD
jgi:hypothetical protein